MVLRELSSCGSQPPPQTLHMNNSLRLLIAESETEEARTRRQQSTGRSSGETFAATLVDVQPGCTVELVRPVEDGAPEWTSDALSAFDGIFLSGSPLHAWDDTPPVQRHKRFMDAVFQSGTPSFGSCAGLQIAAAVAGGSVRLKTGRHEAGLARRISATAAGREHPLLDGRPASWDALCIHSDEVDQLPLEATLLASNASTLVQAAEIRWRSGVFWGVQYHPELPPGEVADALRRQSESIIAQDLARSVGDVEAVATLLAELDADPGRADVQWRLGTNEQVADEERRTLEVRNFLNHLVAPTREQRRSTPHD